MFVMADILTQVFTSFNAQRSLDVKVALPRSRSVLVVGERRVSQAMLLLAALTAADLGLRIVFLTQTPLQRLPAALQARMANLTPDSLKKIRFVYPRTEEELLQEVACLHERCAGAALPPALLVVEGLEGYLRCGGGGHQGQQTSAAHVSALLLDTAAFLTRALEETPSGHAPCRVFASFQPEPEGRVAGGGEPSAPDPLLQVLDRYFPLRCTLDPVSHPGSAADTWHVYLSGTGVSDGAAAAEGGEEGLDAAREWRLDIQPNGSMEFSVV